MSWTSGEIWVLMAVVGAGTFALRYSFIHWFGKRDIPPWLQRGLRFVPAAVLAALVFPTIIYSGPDAGWQLENSRLWAGAIAAVVAWRTRDVLWTLAAGMAALWLIRALF